MYGTDGTLVMAAGSGGSLALADTVAANGSPLWVLFAVVALSFAAATTKQLLARPRDHRP
jgi:ABC-type uncharacterized transport system permease subunit